MLRITVELVPHGIESQARTLSTTYVGNTGGADRYLGDYVVYDEDPRGNIILPVGYVSGWQWRDPVTDEFADERGLAAIALKQVYDASDKPRGGGAGKRA